MYAATAQTVHGVSKIRPHDLRSRVLALVVLEAELAGEPDDERRAIRVRASFVQIQGAFEQQHVGVDIGVHPLDGKGRPFLPHRPEHRKVGGSLVEAAAGQHTPQLGQAVLSRQRHARIIGAAAPESGYCAPMADTVLIHPNRDKAESKATRVGVILLLLASAGLILVVTLGGWSQLQGAQPVSFAYVIIYVGMALFVARWNRGVLPVAAALAILFAVVAAVAGPAWFERDKAGFDDPTLEPSILGLLTIILVPVQLLLIAFALRGFQQQWNVEVEVTRDEAERYRRGDREPGQVQPA